MKKVDLKVGMIVEDRSWHAQKVIKRPYKLILNITELGYSYLESSKADHFWIPVLFDTKSCTFTSFRRVNSLRLIR